MAFFGFSSRTIFQISWSMIGGRIHGPWPFTGDLFCFGVASSTAAFLITFHSRCVADVDGLFVSDCVTH